MADSHDSTFQPFSQPIYVSLKPAGPRCNLSCSYCYYLGKQQLFPSGEMSDELLELFIQFYIESQLRNDILFIWHGGEPTLRPLSFYEKAMALQHKYGKDKQIRNCLQTNGTLLTSEWCKFLHDNNWLVGVSIDGPPEMHDCYRKSKTGHESCLQVLRGIQLLQQYNVDWNAMIAVHASNVEHPLDVYHFFKQLGCNYLQLTPVVERTSNDRLLAPHETGDTLTPESITPAQWGNFLCKIFDEWVRNDVGRVFVETFDHTLANWMGITPGSCTLADTCGHALALEHNGDLYACDHFVFPAYRLGNLHQQSLISMAFGEQQRQFSRLKRESLPAKCRQCSFLFTCHGECPKNRFCSTKHGEPGLNYLCEGYYQYFQHVAPCMEYMKTQLQQGLPPANIMTAIQNGLINL